MPEGRRNTWLHLYATCLTQEHGVADLENTLRTVASLATPDLKESEVDAVIKSALKRAEAAYASNPNVDGRLNYSGATVAELLDVSDTQARQLQLRQVFSLKERTRSNRERLTARRRLQGMQPREEYLAKQTISARRLWVDHGISRATWYRRGCPPSPQSQERDDTADSDETGLVTLLGGLPLGTTRETAVGGIPSQKSHPHPHRRKPQVKIGGGFGHLEPSHPPLCASRDAQRRMASFQGDLPRSS